MADNVITMYFYWDSCSTEMYGPYTKKSLLEELEDNGAIDIIKVSGKSLVCEQVFARTSTKVTLKAGETLNLR